MKDFLFSTDFDSLARTPYGKQHSLDFDTYSAVYRVACNRGSLFETFREISTLIEYGCPVFKDISVPQLFAYLSLIFD